MRKEVGDQLFNHTFLKICIRHLATMIYCCTTTLVYKLCIRNKTKVVPYMSMVSLFSKFTFTYITMASSQCQPFLNIRLLSTPSFRHYPPPHMHTHEHTHTYAHVHNAELSLYQQCFIFIGHIDHYLRPAFSIKTVCYERNSLYLNAVLFRTLLLEMPNVV